MEWILISIVVVLAAYAGANAWIFLFDLLTSSHAKSNPGAPVGVEVPLDLLPLKGRQGICVKPLRPAGGVEIEGKRYPARCVLGLSEQGERVKVVGVEGVTLVVEKCER